MSVMSAMMSGTREIITTERYVVSNCFTYTTSEPTLVSAGPDYQDPLVMINARLFRALVDAPSNIGHSCFPRLLAALPTVAVGAPADPPLIVAAGWRFPAQWQPAAALPPPPRSSLSNYSHKGETIVPI